ncbi:hypothetical protein [Streptomyces sp. NPDC047042]|uniref:hypothetical protein n=1 Tax=Streptomyces sp. NPDC047042 TaxID=3154807 RepID=UPI0033EA7925
MQFSKRQGQGERCLEFLSPGQSVWGVSDFGGAADDVEAVGGAESLVGHVSEQVTGDAEQCAGAQGGEGRIPAIIATQ